MDSDITNADGSVRKTDETLTIHEGDPQFAKKPLTQWGAFQIVESVGAGGFGEVYRAFDTVLQREVALKLLLPRSQVNQEKAILREARLLAKVRHANVVSVYGVDTHDGRVGFWSDFVKGRTLTQLLALQGPFGPREAALVGIDLCRALSAVHAAGLLHRDIKASNVMREEGGRILLMDFGLSLEDRAQHGLGGTPAYMAPELFTGGQASVASDIYALGILLYHLLTAKYPVDVPTVQEFTAAHDAGNRRSLYEQRTDLPDQFVQVIEKAIRKNPAERFQSAGQMLSALSESVGTGSVQAVSPLPVAAEQNRVYWWLALPVLVFACAVVWFTPIRQTIPFLRSGLSFSGTGAHATYQQAQDLLDKYYVPGNLDKAIAGFQNTIRMDKQFALAYGGMCRAYYYNYRDRQTPELLKNTQDTCSKALDLDQDLASVHVTLGNLYTFAGKNDLADQEVQEALRLDSKNAEAYGALAYLYSKQGRSKDVEPTYQRAADLAPGDWRWPNQLGTYYLTIGRFEDAANQYKIATSLTPGNPRAWDNLGIAYARQSRYEEAKAAESQALRLEPENANFNANLGNVLAHQGNYAEAADLFLKAAKLNATNYLTWGNLASIYDRIPGDHDKARESYLKAISLAEEARSKSPADANLISLLGSYYATLNMPEKSLPLLRQAAALEPDNPQVLFRAGEGYELLHHREEALHWIGLALGKKYSLETLKRNPEMAALIADRRFAAIAAKYQ